VAGLGVVGETEVDDAGDGLAWRSQIGMKVIRQGPSLPIP
jgi:hypothetical protein